MLEVEDWTQPSHNKRKGSSRKVSVEPKEEEKEFIHGSSPPPPALPPGPPEAEVEDSFQVTHPPNSHLFPVRTRANSSPTARPSSLSRLLAQATPETLLHPDQKSPIRTPSPTTSPPPPPSPSHHTGSIPHHAPVAYSPLRPGSRASRLSITSKFSVGRVPALAGGASGSPIAKAAPTTALSEQPLASSPSSGDANPFGLPSTPSPDGSISDGMANVILSRRRTTSYHIPKTSPLAASSSSQSTTNQAVRPTVTASSTLANLANSWGMPFSRRKRVELGTTSNDIPVKPVSSINATPDNNHTEAEASASELLKRF